MILPRIPAPSEKAAHAAEARIATLIKPPGSLGQLEALAVTLAGLTDNERPRLPRKAAVVMAGDHAVAAEGVSIAPSAVTALMVMAMVRGQAAISVLCRQAGVRLSIVDVGMAHDVDADVRDHPRYLWRRIAEGAANIASGPAMTREQVEAAVGVGLAVASSEIAAGLDILAIGEMGIGNTTPAAAITACLLGADPASVTGVGTGLDDVAHQKKIAIVQQALSVNQPDPNDALDVLAKVGGYEIAAMAGLAIGSAARRVPVVVDGFIATAAALAAVRLSPALQPYLIAGHQSTEPGHGALLQALGKTPLLQLDMRLGEGTGAVLALHLAEAAARTLDEMATFAEAGIAL